VKILEEYECDNCKKIINDGEQYYIRENVTGKIKVCATCSNILKE